MIAGCEVEASVVRIPKPVDDAVCKSLRPSQPAFVEGQLIQGKQAIRDVGVIVEIGVEPRPAVFETVKQPLAVP